MTLVADRAVATEASGTLERPLLIPCGGRDTLLGILHPADGSQRPAVLVIVGGPQYRVGSHRQFTLLARALAAQGYPVLRFDYRGMGDSDGEPRTFESVEDDIRAALDALVAHAPTADGVVLFGLCDAASAALMYCASDRRVRGLMLANPWVTTAVSEARAYVWYYYPRRLLQKSFWMKLVSGKLNVLASVRGLIRSVAQARGSGDAQKPAGSYIDRMLSGLTSFRGPVLLQLSGVDLTAHAFRDLCRRSAPWTAALRRTSITARLFPKADHTFSKGDSLAQSIELCTAWLARSFGGAKAPLASTLPAAGDLSWL